MAQLTKRNPEIPPVWRAWGPAWCWLAVIWYASSIVVRPGMFPQIRYGDKLFHGGEFFIYGYFIQRGASYRRWLDGWQGLALVAAVIVLTGMSDEWHQAFVPTRSADLYDFLVDVYAGGIGMLAYWWNRHAATTPESP